MGAGYLKGSLEMLLLAVLEAGPAHGYAVISALRERSEGEFDLPEGTIYPALHKLEREGVVRSSWQVAAGRRRRVYSLTERGARALRQQRTEWATFQQGVQSVLAWST
jgi:PadR family transcriptional regulator, regulatory protein PadR